jgi:hypothetical protein
MNMTTWAASAGVIFGFTVEWVATKGGSEDSLSRAAKSVVVGLAAGALFGAGSHFYLRPYTFESMNREFNSRYREIMRASVLRAIKLEGDEYLSEWHRDERIRQELVREFSTKWPLVELHKKLLEIQAAIKDALIMVQALLDADEIKSIPEEIRSDLQREQKRLTFALERARDRLKVACGSDSYAQQLYLKKQHEIACRELEGDEQVRGIIGFDGEDGYHPEEPEEPDFDAGY